ncbi:ABC transporter transmembrane region [Venustampulla echinocandica]|uniref:ABC transporter transmembrane region n=1 Tax=Venustampulla echinocandica TaxID=2656787 RepID=A0A370TJ24_9HELO|nr:ABC transporter transmembrane region [Venustampulla echinocandica]RDL35361.1 ABC transporter transmembrane region [Venustampulla echinocandica]
MFAHCRSPIWRVDDISNCVQRDYLKVLFPLIAIGISSLLLILQAVLRNVKLKRNAGYKSLPNGSSAANGPSGTENGRPTVPGYANGSPTPDEVMEEEEEEDDVLTMGGGRLVLTKTTTRGSVAAVDSPRGQYTILVVELLAIVAIVSINVVALVIRAYGPKGTPATVAGIATWVYILILASSRLLLSRTRWRIPRVWNHTAALYTVLWLCSIISFRSAIIHPRSGAAQALVMSEFALTTLVFSIAIGTRKGNKTVVLEWEDGIEPSREPLASLFSIATFSWVDSIVWQGYRKTFELPDVWNLVPKEKAAAVIADYRQLSKTAALTWHLMRYFRGVLVVQCSYAVVGGIFTFAPTLLLKSILEYIEDPESAPRNVIWLFVIMLSFTDILRSLADQQALWIGRKISVKLRAIMVGEIYAKALRRKAAAGSDTLLGDKKDKADAAKDGMFKKLLGLGKKKATSKPDSDPTVKDPTAVRGADEQVNVGTIINLMSVDSFKVSEITAYLHFLFAAGPTQLIVCIYLLYRILGLSSIPGLVIMFILLPINIAIARGFGAFQKKIMAATDKRIHTTNEVLQNIRIIKFFAWEHRFSNIVNDKRAVELKSLRSKYILWAFAVAVWNTAPVVITFFSFLCYTMIEKKPLYPSIAFTAISLFTILRVPLDQLGDMIAHVLESKVSVDRVEEFLNEEETEKYDQLRHDCRDEDGDKMIGFKDATISWGGKESSADQISDAFRLPNLNIKFAIGDLNIIAGPTGSGKTSLLMALLGEMTCIKGKVFLPGGGYSREDVRPDPETGLTETVAYCAQQAWLVNANIKDNILFAAPLDEARYRQVIVACALQHDLEVLDAGDETLVGEKGVTLSGGQKQRISLARALYSNSMHVLLDDCLSAVDSHTAKWIFEKCIRGPLMQGRTCILVTHNLALCVPQSRYVVYIEDGKIAIQGSAEEVIASGKLGEDFIKSRPGSAIASQIPSRVPSSVGDESGGTLVDDMGTAPGAKSKKAQKAKSAQQDVTKDAMSETKAEGGVKLPVIALYLKAMGPWWFWVLALAVFGIHNFGILAGNVWIREWANQYSTESVSTYHTVSTQGYLGNSISTVQVASSRIVQLQPFFNPTKTSLLAKFAPDVDVAYYLTIYAIIGILSMFIALFRDLWLFFGSLTASWHIHTRLMESVTRAKFKFFDATPLGQIMNRFSKDLEAVDQEVAPIAIGVMSCALSIVVTVALITVITPGFLVAAILISFVYFFVGRFYLRSSRDLKRIESVQRSPLFQQFGETLSGITTIRAYGEEKRFIRDNMHRINNYSRPYIYLWAANRWLAFRIDVIGDLVAFFAGAFVVFNIGKIDAGSAGLSLSYALSFTENVLWLVRLYSMNEQNMNSVERIKEYLEVEQEAAPIIEKTRPAANWPSEGSVEFVNYTTRYRADLDPVLRDVSFKINPLEKVGIVGRTGAGKSSLALALFRGLEAEEGKIFIDGVDIGLIGLQDLRGSITIVPQDPTLFTGTIRTNLDPFDLFTDEDIFTALRRVQLIGVPTSAGASTVDLLESPDTPTSTSTPGTNKNVFLNLSSPVAESGNNLSQGQRQLLCLARALLKNPKVLMMDEATASIDYNTDSKIQETIRELKSTIITIAHRLQTIVDYDKVLVLDKGQVVEYGHPHELLKKEGPEATFKGMCEMSGDLEALQKAAKKAWDAKKLIDDE